ncbi:hypothetical protein Ahy_A10g051284 [Arachis hypogaea]|uniref:Uncharacterized protein n=1 Tax=Arachis hypogaea TaxID=3818 RepID=A0A445BC82_ARAHY|nr:hypothetical protein Ahy_A10g051284 [Arachis hypogaea]
MPRKPRYNIIWEPPKDAKTDAGTEETTVGSMTREAQTSREQPRDRAPPISSSANRAPATRINGLFRAPHIDHRIVQSSSADDPQTPTEQLETRHRAKVADHELEDEDYDPKTDEVLSFDDYIDDLFAAQEVEHQHQNGKRRDTDFWEVTVIEDGVRKASRLSVREAIALPFNTKIVLPFNKELQPIGEAVGLFSGFLESLGADYSQFPISVESWKHVNKAKKEHAYDMIKRVFHYEDDARGKIKRDILKRIGKNWKDTRHHFNLAYCIYRATVNSCLSNVLYICRKQFRMLRGRMDPLGTFSQNDSLAQVLRKEHSGRVRVLGAGPCPTQVFGNDAGQPSSSAGPNEGYERRIAELTAKLEEEQAKRQSIHKVLGYLVQQQGGNLPVEVDAELAFLGGTPDSSSAGPSSSANQDPQQKF